MTEAQLLVEVRRLAALVEAQGREVPELVRRAVREELQRDLLTPAQRAAARLVIRLYGAGEIITSAGAIDAARYDEEGRANPRITCYADPQKFGIVLGQVARSGAIVDGMRLVSLPKEGNAARWVLEEVEPL